MLQWTDVAWELKGTWVCNLNDFVEDTKLTCKTPASKINQDKPLVIWFKILFFTVHAFVCKVTLNIKGRHCRGWFFFLFQNKRTSKKKKKNFQGLKKKTSLVLTQPVLFYYLKTKTKMFFLLKEETFFFNLCHFLFHHNLLYAKQ